MPAILTCLVGKRLCEKPTENHWELRDYCATLVSYICRRFGTAYKTLQPRITKTLLHAFLDPTKPLTTHYGAVVGLSALGIYVIQLLLLPNIASYHRLLESELSPSNPNQQKFFEARKVNDALLVKSPPRAFCLTLFFFFFIFQLLFPGSEDKEGFFRFTFFRLLSFLTFIPYNRELLASFSLKRNENLDLLLLLLLLLRLPSLSLT
jgi:hypothetical protein